MILYQLEYGKKPVISISISFNGDIMAFQIEVIANYYCSREAKIDKIIVSFSYIWSMSWSGDRSQTGGDKSQKRNKGQP